MTLLEASDVNVAYHSSKSDRIWSVRDVDLRLDEGEFVGLVGESGCGKSTLGFALTRMLRPPANLEGGSIIFDGTDVATLEGEALRRQRRGGFALVLQSGMNALNPVRTIGQQFGDVLRAHAEKGHRPKRAEIRTVGEQCLSDVSLDADVLDRYAHELSGGMRQRVAIALALALAPKMIVFDEPTTALDVIVQKAVMTTIRKLQAERSFTGVLISHDLGVVLDATSRVLVMYGGKILEDMPSEELSRGLHHPYTEALLRCYADPRADEVHLEGIPGTPPDLSKPDAGCAFAPRCPLAQERCRTEVPELRQYGPGKVACHVRAPHDLPGKHTPQAAPTDADSVRAVADPESSHE